MTTESAKDWRVRWRFFFSEAIGTAALVFGGLSVVVVMFGDGSPMGRIVPNERLRTALTAYSARDIHLERPLLRTLGSLSVYITNC